jgi:hypothetical protein
MVVANDRSTAAAFIGTPVILLQSTRVKRIVLLFVIAVAFPAESQVTQFLMQQASGTAANPGGHHHGVMLDFGKWEVMVHGLAFLNDMRATGPRGGDKTFSTNWAMVSAHRGNFMLRTMLSLEPATISGRKYPELFQTGETAFGKQIIDGQHPHDLFMELAAEYARSFGKNSIAYLYVAPVGDPALGPVAFPHRDSAIEIPQAVLGHHFEDSTHITYDVITAGIGRGPLRFEASSFHGAEPDEQRWDLDGGKLDSASARLTITPTDRLSMQASFGYLTKPEKLEPGDQKRWTASASYTRGAWASSIIWGRVYKESHDINVDAYLAESTFRWGRNTFAGRLENAEKDELFPHFHRTGRVDRPALPVPVFRIKSATVGYTFDFLIRGPLRLGAGGNYTWYRFPAVLNGFYGERPRARMLLVRARYGV